MQEAQNYKIYSIQIDSNQSRLIEIETIILNGLYRFSILGINQKHSSDTKDRIYSALRSQRLTNLKSNNKKITVNLIPTDIDKRANIYDLGIALSCLSCMGQIHINEDVLVLGKIYISINREWGKNNNLSPY
jgi:predicted ATPase with chaperone activity